MYITVDNLYSTIPIVYNYELSCVTDSTETAEQDGSSVSDEVPSWSM